MDLILFLVGLPIVYLNGTMIGILYKVHPLEAVAAGACMFAAILLL